MHAPKERKARRGGEPASRHCKTSDEDRGRESVRAHQSLSKTTTAQLNGSTHHPNETAFSMGLLASQQLQCGDGLLGPLTHSRR